MAVITPSGAFYNYMKANTIIDKVFYIESDGKTKSPYLTITQVDEPEINLILCEEDGQTSFLVSVFQSSYTKGINNRQLIADYVKKLRGLTKNNFKFYKVLIVNSWDGDKNIDNLYTFNFEVLVSWEKTS